MGPHREIGRVLVYADNLLIARADILHLDIPHLSRRPGGSCDLHEISGAAFLKAAHRRHSCSKDEFCTPRRRTEARLASFFAPLSAPRLPANHGARPSGQSCTRACEPSSVVLRHRDGARRNEERDENEHCELAHPHSPFSPTGAHECITPDGHFPDLSRTNIKHKLGLHDQTISPTGVASRSFVPYLR